MANYNRVILAGNMTRGVEVRTTQGGTTTGKFGLAVNRKWGEKETTLFIDCVVFGKAADVLAQHTGKGSAVLVEGRLELQQWEDKEGNKRSKHEVVVDNFQFLGDATKGSSKPAKAKEAAPEGSGTDYGDIPF